MSRFKPVELPPEKAPNGAISMTALRHFNACPRSGYLYLLYKGAAQNVAMVRGSAFHEVAQRATEAMLAQGEPQIPGDLVKSIMQEVLESSPVPVSEQDYLREIAYRWAEKTTIDPSAVIGVEQLIALRLGNWTVRCKLDLVEMVEGGFAVRIDDYKTSRAAPPYEDVGRKRPDGTIAGKDFQLVLYALAAAYGTPLRVEDVPVKGQTVTTPYPEGATLTLRAKPDGENTLHVEIPEPFPLAAQAQRFDLRLVFPGIETKDGEMVTRNASLTPLELAEYRASIEAVLANFEHSLETGDWPAIESHEACSECPARRLCPIPRELRTFAGEINDEDELVEALERWERDDADLRARKAEIRAFIKGHKLREVRYGRSRAMRFVYSESERIENREQMWAAIERAVTLGEPFNKSEFVKTSGSTNLKAVELTVGELAEQEGLDA